MIPIKKEDKDLYKEFGYYEKCVFCLKQTDTWHFRTNNAVCKECSKTYDTYINATKQKRN